MKWADYLKTVTYKANTERKKASEYFDVYWRNWRYSLKSSPCSSFLNWVIFFLWICKNSWHSTNEIRLSGTYNAGIFVHSVICLFTILNAYSSSPEIGGKVECMGISSISWLVWWHEFPVFQLCLFFVSSYSKVGIVL